MRGTKGKPLFCPCKWGLLFPCLGKTFLLENDVEVLTRQDAFPEMGTQAPGAFMPGAVKPRALQCTFQSGTRLLGLHQGGLCLEWAGQTSRGVGVLGSPF